MIVNIHAAKTNLSKLIEKAEAGEEVVIARNGKPACKLTPVEPPHRPSARRRAPLARVASRPDMDAPMISTQTTKRSAD